MAICILFTATTPSLYRHQFCLGCCSLSIHPSNLFLNIHAHRPNGYELYRPRTPPISHSIIPVILRPLPRSLLKCIPIQSCPPSCVVSFSPSLSLSLPFIKPSFHHEMHHHRSCVTSGQKGTEAAAAIRRRPSSSSFAVMKCRCMTTGAQCLVLL